MSGDAVIKLSKDGHAFFWCPGCDGLHYVNVEPTKEGSPRPVWGFNGKIDKPTFTPSVLLRTTKMTPKGEQAYEAWAASGYPKHPEGFRFDNEPYICHSFVTDGQIQFLGDCSHELANQTVPLPPYPEGKG